MRTGLFCALALTCVLQETFGYTNSTTDTIRQVLHSCLSEKQPCACVDLSVVNSARFPNNHVDRFLCHKCAKANSCKTVSSACLASPHDCDVRHCRRECWCKCAGNSSDASLFIPCSKWCDQRPNCPRGDDETRANCPYNHYNYLQMAGLTIFLIVFAVSALHLFMKSKLSKFTRSFCSCCRRNLHSGCRVCERGLDGCRRMLRPARPARPPESSRPTREEVVDEAETEEAVTYQPRRVNIVSDSGGDAPPPSYTEALHLPAPATPSQSPVTPPLIDDNAPPSYQDACKDIDIDDIEISV